MTTVGKLHVSTPSDTEIRMTREFSAPRALVFDAMTKPELLKRWLGVFRGWTLPTCDVDLRAGGSLRYEWRNADGRTMGMNGVFREVVVPERLVCTEQFDDAWYPGNNAVSTMEFVERGGKTMFTVTVRYESKEARDVAMKSGMEQGMVAGYDMLESLLVSEFRGAGVRS